MVYNMDDEEEEEEMFVYFNFKLIQMQKELQT